MKWFKHQSNARNDERLAKLEDKAGLEAYGFYFKMLEIVAEIVDESDRCEVTFSLSRWGRQANITSKKFLFLLQCCSDVGLMLARRDCDDICVKIPNLLKHRDNHTKNLQVTSKQEIDIEEDKERDIEEDNINISDSGKNQNQPSEKPPSRFDEFWSAYPSKKGKKPALDLWKRKRLDNKADDLIADVKLRNSSDRKWINGFIPNASTYLNQERWNDEIEPVRANTQPRSNGSDLGEINRAVAREAAERYMAQQSTFIEADK